MTNYNKSKSIPLFPSDILYSNVFDSITNEELKYIHNLPITSPENTPDPKGFGVNSVDTYVLDSPPLSNLSRWILNEFETYSKEILGYNFYSLTFLQSWVSVKLPNQYHTKHCHSNSFLSGVFYFDQSPEDNPIIFFKDEKAITSDSFSNLHHQDINYPPNHPLCNIITYTPVKNELIIFPSTLFHSVAPNESNKPRKSLAMNVFPKSHLGDKYNLTELDFRRLI